MVSPARSSARKVSQSAHLGTSMLLEISTLGENGWVRKTATGLPDWTSRVSSSARSRRALTIASNAGQLRAALPEPPYTTRSSQRSATSGSRLFMSIRSAASCGQPLQESVLPRGARIGWSGRRVGRLLLVTACPPGSRDRTAAKRRVAAIVLWATSLLNGARAMHEHGTRLAPANALPYHPGSRAPSPSLSREERHTETHRDARRGSPPRRSRRPGRRASLRPSRAAAGREDRPGHLPRLLLARHAEALRARGRPAPFLLVPRVGEGLRGHRPGRSGLRDGVLGRGHEPMDADLVAAHAGRPQARRGGDGEGPGGVGQHGP